MNTINVRNFKNLAVVPKNNPFFLPFDDSQSFSINGIIESSETGKHKLYTSDKYKY